MITKQTERWKYVLSDWLTANLAFVLFSMFRFFQHYKFRFDPYCDTLGEFLTLPKLLIEQACFPLMMLAVYWVSGFYNRPLSRSSVSEVLMTASSSIINTLIIFIILLSNDTSNLVMNNIEVLLALFGLLFGCTYLGRYILRHYRRRMIRTGHWRYKVVVIGTPADTKRTIGQLRKSWQGLGFNVVGAVLLDKDGLPSHPKNAGKTETDGVPVIDFAAIPEMAARHEVSQVLIATRSITEERMLDLLRHLFPLNISVKITPDIFSLVTRGINLRDIYGEPFIDLTSPHMSDAGQNVKRIFDVVLSSLALIVLSPLMAVVALMVKRSSEGPVFYSQERIGLRGVPFRIFKFRTMVSDAEAGGPALSSDDDPRVTRLGHFLRKYRIDELPQFWNVIRGDMSIVGPRPEREYFINQIVKEAPYYTLVHQVRPGVTSWGMVKFGYASDVEQMIERSKYDLIYISNMSLSLDVKIMIYTVRTIFLGKGK